MVSTEEDWIGALLWIVLTVIIVTSGTVYLFSLAWTKRRRFGRDRWYKQLKKPPATPPPWVFAVLWPILYGLITASIWVYWRQGPENGNALYLTSLSLYSAQLVLNGLWVTLFFLLHFTALAAIDLSLIIVISVIKLVLFGVQSAWIPLGLFAPYVVWLLYAFYLNIGVVILNPL